MSDLPRVDVLEPDSLIHKIWRGHNREWIFKSDDEKSEYLKRLNMAISKDASDLHAICVMSNHVHEIHQIKEVKKFSNFLRNHHGQFGAFYNKKHQRKGAVSESRPKIVLIKDEIHEMASVLYIHANPLRAGIVSSIEELKDYEFSTHILYGYGIRLDWMKPIVLPQWYIDLGSTDEERQRIYLHLFHDHFHIQSPSTLLHQKL